MWKKWITLILLLVFSNQSHGVLKIEITKGVAGALPIAIVPFETNGAVLNSAQRIDNIIQANLARSGYFSPIPKSDFLAWPTEASHVRCKDWSILGAENIVIGSIRPIGNAYEVRYVLFDVLRCAQIEGQRFRVHDNQLRKLAHQISDQIYEALTGTPGAFSTSIAYVTALRNTRGKPRFALQVADSDGYAPKTIMGFSEDPIISPAWSPDGSKIAYATFEHGPVTVYVQDVASGERQRLLNTRNQVSSPAWSPDGRKLAVVMSRKGRRDIYIVDMATRGLQQLTRTSSANFNTEPVWSPDGKTIVYTAHSGGRPQLYQIDLSTKRVKRLTFEGKYNTRGTFSPDGKLLAMVHGDSSGYHIAVLELETGTFRVLTETGLDESPTFAPNGSMILYATRDRRRGVLAAVSADGRVSQRYELLDGGDAREPAWGPFLKP